MEQLNTIPSEMSCSVHIIVFPRFSLCSSFLLLTDSGDKEAGKTQSFQQSSGFQMDNIGLSITVHKSEEFQDFCL